MSSAADYALTYMAQLKDCLSRVQVHAGTESLSLETGIERAVAMVREMHAKRGKLMLIGNGASAAIASHQAADFMRAASMAACAFNDAPLLTCLGNDLGYERTFEVPVGLVGRPEDILCCISSSGASPNILRAADRGRQIGCTILSLSGFAPDNPLRGKGDLSFYVPSSSYGKVEVVHLSILHCVCDHIVGR